MATTEGSRHVRLFKNGRSQALRIPREFELPGSEAIIRREGDRLIVEAVTRVSLRERLREWSPLTEDWPQIDSLPAGEVDL